MLTPAQVEALLAGTLDVGLLRPPVGSPDLAVHVIRRESLVAVLPSDHPAARRRSVRLADLAAEPFVSYPSHFRSVVHDAVEMACGKAGFSSIIVQKVSETATLVSFVAAGIGVALVPASVQHLRITGAVYRPLMGRAEEVALAIASRVDDPSPVVRQVLSRVGAWVGGVRAVPADVAAVS
jgi:DNA-binding transcriptional LysR family regulator